MKPAEPMKSIAEAREKADAIVTFVYSSTFIKIALWLSFVNSYFAQIQKRGMYLLTNPPVGGAAPGAYRPETARTLRIRRAACREPSRAEKRREILGLAALETVKKVAKPLF